MSDPFDVSLHDHELHQEVLITTLLMIAPNQTDGCLGQEQVDRILGVHRFV
ncbi:MAG: hypothetical protein ACXVXC_11630 [Nocardioidaceae bacterium]